MTVFVIQEPRSERDLSSAADYGPIHFLLDSGDNPSSLPGPCLHKMVKALTDFDPEEDYITCAGGDPAGMTLLGFALATLPGKWVNYLRWDRVRKLDGSRSGQGVYIPVKMPKRA